MKDKIKDLNLPPAPKMINVRLDAQTFITLSRMSSLDVWLKRYPAARVITR